MIDNYVNLVVSNGELEIRYPNISDLEDIVHINRISLPENYTVAYFIGLIKSWRETSCVAVYKNKVVGYTIMRIEGSINTPWKPRNVKKGHIISVAVLPDLRRLGIGNKMMAFVTEKALALDKVKEITLEVRQSNLPAVNMYRNLNFVSHKIINGYYSDGEDAILMKLYLSQLDI